ncbi:MAG: hypothetical protein WCK53_10200 [Methanomicrobiales archaeon]
MGSPVVAMNVVGLVVEDATPETVTDGWATVVSTVFGTAVVGTGVCTAVCC